MHGSQQTMLPYLQLLLIILMLNGGITSGMPTAKLQDNEESDDEQFGCNHDQVYRYDMTYHIAKRLLCWLCIRL